MKEARYYETLPDKKVKCILCPHNCIIKDGKNGICLGRKNTGGVLYSVIYGEVVSIANDPIEKKPLYHFHPGSSIISIGCNGCNFKCEFCQNWTISQVSSPARSISPQQMISITLREKSIGIAYTYTEPLIWFEYVLETSKLAKEKGLVNVLVTNGYINEKPLEELLPFIDAANVDVKSMNSSFYSKICHSKLNPVLKFVEKSFKKIHIEITNLVIPGLNDTEDDFGKLIDWVASLDSEIPLHFSRYYPCYKFNIPSTPASTLIKARDMAMKKLKYVYIGNLPTQNGSTTICPDCGKVIIERNGYYVGKRRVKEGKCEFCSHPIKGVWT